MEEDKELVLSLGLGCGRASSPSKERGSNSADDVTDTDDRTSKILNDFRNFLNAGGSQSFQKSEPVKPQEDFFNNFQQTASGGNDLSNGAGANDHKRKRTSVDMKSSIKLEADSYNSDLQAQEKHSHISITTDEGSTGDNDDVAESEAEGSTSKMALHRDDGSKTPVGSATSSQAPKETANASNANAPYVITIQESPSASSLNTSIYPSSMDNIPPTTGGHQRPHGATAGNVSMSLTYSSLQNPDKNSPWGMTQPQPLLSHYAGKFTPTSVSMQVTTPYSSEATRPDIRQLYKLRGPPKASQLESGAPAARSNNSFPSEYPAIKPGVASEVKLGGSGSFPNLPWVSTTGPGPNGKTISGVTYKYNATQIKIVCACHGKHLSPEEFILHAIQDHGIHLSPEEFIQHATQDQSTGLAVLQSSNSATTSAMS